MSGEWIFCPSRCAHMVCLTLDRAAGEAAMVPALLRLIASSLLLFSFSSLSTNVSHASLSSRVASTSSFTDRNVATLNGGAEHRKARFAKVVVVVD